MPTNTFKSTSTALTTSIADIYQAPASAGNVAIMLSIQVANVNGSNPGDLTIAKTDSSNNIAGYLAYTIPVPADAAIEVVANKVVLMAGQKIRGLASSNSYLQATVSVLEIT
jgi:hypothetical protein